MQVGDLVKLRSNIVPLIGCSSKLGIVVRYMPAGLRYNRVIPTVVVQWNGMKGTMGHRVNMLEVVSESR